MANEQRTELLNRQLAFEASQSSQERLWAARADAYADYLGWLRGELRETLKYRMPHVVDGTIPSSWWKTPYDLGNRMRLFESETVRGRRAALAVDLAAIGQVVAMLEGSPAAKRTLGGLQTAADEALSLIDELLDAIRVDMQGSDGIADGGEFLEDLADLNSVAAQRARIATREALEALRESDQQTSRRDEV